jgi:hypothetical protein
MGEPDVPAGEIRVEKNPRGFFDLRQVSRSAGGEELSDSSTLASILRRTLMSSSLPHGSDEPFGQPNLMKQVFL